jgi:hypothetical protein
MQREGLSGEVVTLFHSYSEIGIGLRVSYGIFFATGAKVPTAINVQPASGGRTEATQDSEGTLSVRAGGFGVV